jgi:hypothetical protein
MNVTEFAFDDCDGKRECDQHGASVSATLDMN